ncbi:MAG: hypothetical protein EXX96DRAFT_168772 [Benjaminiella poitrasii]|nr:MAG: hypothetical protein EXX96DRAFT_168772 [Benjaminiella poitrasii]
MADFEDDWKARFMSTAKMLDIDVEQSRDSWSLVQERIQTSTKSSSDDSTDTLKETQSVLTESSASSSKSSSTRQSSTDKNYKLTAEEKKKSRMIYESLDALKMWTLSTEKIVEKKMALFASNCIYEYSVHSLILDMSDDILKFLSILLIDFDNPLDLYYQANSQVSHPFEEKDKKWVQQIIRSAADLYLYKILDSYSSMEAKVIHRVWSFLYTLFDGPSIR